MDTVVAAGPTQLLPSAHHLEIIGDTASAHSASGVAHLATHSAERSSVHSNSEPAAAAAATATASPTTHISNVPPFDKLPLELLGLVASLVAHPFYPPPPPEDAQPTPEPYVIASLDPHPSSPTTVSAELSAITKTCSHVLGASRPWLWETIDVRSGKGWLAVVDALTEVVDDDAGPVSPEIESDGTGSQHNSHQNSPCIAPTTAPAADGNGNGNVDALRSSVGSADQVFPTSGSSTPPDYPIESAGIQPTHTTTSQPVGAHVGFPFHRAVTIDLASSGLYDRPRTLSAGIPLPRRLSMLQSTPPGSRNASPSGARLRGRSRSPRRGLDFETEGISSVLSRSLSLTHPLMRQSSLSRFLTADNCEPAPLVPEPSFMAADDNPNPDMLPPPGPYIRHLSFTNFSTISGRRTGEEALRNRFVTSGRFEGVIKNAPNLRTICMTPYVDGSLSYPVVEEIFFRGYNKPRVFRPRSTSFSPSARGRSISLAAQANEQAQSTMDDQHDPPRPVYVPYEDENEEQQWHRRRMFTPVEALDFTGCVSRNFTAAAKEFGENWLDLGIEEEETTDEERGRSRGRSRRRLDSAIDEDGDEHAMGRNPHRPLFSALRRLSLRNCTSLQADFLQAFILCMPNLTHLDLSGTSTSDSLLRALTENPPRGMRLQSLSLARCRRIAPRTIVDFLVESPVARDLIELNLFVHPTQMNTIDSDDLMDLLKEAPCIRSGRLRYLDLSSAGFTPEHLHPDVFPPQPSLISFGLCHIPELPLRSIADFLHSSAPGVEVLALTGTSTLDLNPEAPALQTIINLHQMLIRPLATVPFSISGLSGHTRPNLSAGTTRLRAIELSGVIRRQVRSEGEWHVIKSKLGRGWYVDVSAGWIPSDTVEQLGYVTSVPPTAGEGRSSLTFVRHLPPSHPRRMYMMALAKADGRVPADVGWHSRKMEVVQGYGMMGREEGMGGSGAYSSEE